MKKITVILFSLSFLLAYSCQTNNHNDIDYLVKAREQYKAKEYNKALSLIDSIRILTPKAYGKISAGELLRDSIIKAINEEKIEIFNQQINSYKQEMYSDNSGTSHWSQKIDSIQQLKDEPRSVINNIANKEVERLACTQCRTAMRQR